ncbi:MAG: hypothetical protein ACE5JL_00175 [Dehalococcoidia bacterium]
MTEGIPNIDRMYPVHPDTQNVLVGSIIVAMFAWVENNASPNWGALHDANQQKPFQWISWDEFINLHKIRHCFAHLMDGTMLPNYAADIAAFHGELSAGRVSKELIKGGIETVKAYYRITGGKVVLEPGAVSRAMQLTITCWSKETNTPLV